MTNAHDPIALFRASAARWPGREALRAAEGAFTYARLDRWSDAISRVLIRSGAGRERIALVAHKRPGTYAAILGILKAGCSYVPLHPDGPAARWERMIATCGARFLLGEGPDITGTKRLPIPGPDDPFIGAADVPAGHEAYVLFTSGSTGGPKGVSVSRTNLGAYLGHLLSTHRLNEHDRFTQFFALTFDLSVHDLFVCWGAGACLCVPLPEGHGMRAAAFAREEKITVWFSVPSLPALLLRMRALTPGSLPTVRHAFFCGEALTWPVARAFANAAPDATLVNLYGPTETTIAITAYGIGRDAPDQAGPVPIGLPFPGHKAMLNNEELCFSGPQLSDGYIGLPEANAEAFPVIGGERWYRTGDRARMDLDGTLHFLGRTDHQVKVAGHRVEPGEIDTVLTPLLQGGKAVSVAVEKAGTARLVTFIDVPADIPALLSACRAQLPPYMVPERVLQLDSIPLTAHGKTDRQRLIVLAQHG